MHSGLRGEASGSRRTGPPPGTLETNQEGGGRRLWFSASRATSTGTPRERSDRGPDFVFPSVLPEVRLTIQQETERYGLDKERMSEGLREEVQCFKAWSKAAINTSRTTAYTSASSTATLDKVGKSVRAYLGYLGKYFSVPASYLSLRDYTDPSRLMHYVAYLKARGSVKGHILNHLGLARKINVYIGSMSPENSPEKQHASRMDPWFATLIQQINSSEQQVTKTGVPEATDLWNWVDQKCSLACYSVRNDLNMSGTVTETSAIFIQEAVIASMVTGRHMPPCRLDLIKHMWHPRHNGNVACADPDCRGPQNCSGNHIEIRTGNEVGHGVGPGMSGEGHALAYHVTDSCRNVRTSGLTSITLRQTWCCTSCMARQTSMAISHLWSCYCPVETLRSSSLLISARVRLCW